MTHRVLKLIMKIVIMKNLIKAEILYLSSIKPKIKIKKEVIKNITKLFELLKIISSSNIFVYLEINKK